MEELITYPIEQFVQKTREISIKEMQELLWRLEDRYEEKQTENEPAQSESEIDRVGNPKPLIRITERLDLKRKIQICQEALLRAKYKETSDRTNNIGFLDATKFSWAMKESEEEVICEGNTGRTYWKKIGGDAPIQANETIRVAICGELRWSDSATINLGAQDGRVEITVPTTMSEDGKRIINSEELLKEAQAQSGDLKLFRVTMQGEEDLQYFTLGSIKNLRDVNKEKLQEYIVRTCLSHAHQDMVRKSLEREECLYTGTIVENENGRFETRFYDSMARAAVKANKSLGTCKTLNGKVRMGYIQDAVDAILGRLARKDSIKSLERASMSGIENESITH